MKLWSLDRLGCVRKIGSHVFRRRNVAEAARHRCRGTRPRWMNGSSWRCRRGSRSPRTFERSGWRCERLIWSWPCERIFRRWTAGRPSHSMGGMGIECVCRSFWWSCWRQSKAKGERRGAGGKREREGGRRLLSERMGHDLRSGKLRLRYDDKSMYITWLFLLQRWWMKWRI